MIDQHASQTTAQHLLQWLSETANVMHPPVPLVGRLATLIGDQRIVFKDSDMTSDLGRYSGRILVFTATHVFLQTVSAQAPTTQGEVLGEVNIQVAARRTLRDLRHAGPVDLGYRYGQHSQWQWPWAVMVELTYGEGTTFTVPLDRNQWRRALNEELLAELLTDLTR